MNTETYPPEIVATQRRLGLRCEAMILLGAIWILMGLGVAFGASQPPDGLFFLAIPAAVRTAVWVATGLLAIISGLRSQQTGSALTGLIIMPIIRAASYVWSWILYLVPGYTGGEYKNGWYQACFYVAMIFIVVFVQHVPPGVLRVGFKSRDSARGNTYVIEE